MVYKYCIPHINTCCHIIKHINDKWRLSMSYIKMTHIWTESDQQLSVYQIKLEINDRCLKTKGVQNKKIAEKFHHVFIL